MGLGSFFKGAVGKILPSGGGLSGWGKLALNLFMYKKRKSTIGRYTTDRAHAEHARRMRRAQQQLSTLTQSYHSGGVKMAGTPSVALNALEKKNIGDIDGYLSDKLRDVRRQRSLARLNMLETIFKQRRKWF